MEIHIKTLRKNPRFLSKTIYFLIGVMVSSLFFSIAIKFFHSYGVYLSLILNITLTYFGFKKSQKDNISRSLTWGIFSMTSVLVLFYLILIIKIATIKI